MKAASRGRLTVALFLAGGAICFSWAVVSIAGLMRTGTEVPRVEAVFRAIGPLGIALVILGGALCGWNLPALRAKAREEERE